MTALLSCDGCGEIVSERPDDSDPTARWWCLSFGPVIGGTGLFPVISMELEDEDDGPDEPPELDRHFCCIGCLSVWAQRRKDEDDA